METINFNSVADIYDNYAAFDFDVPFFLSEAEKSGGRMQIIEN